MLRHAAITEKRQIHISRQNACRRFLARQGFKNFIFILLSRSPGKTGRAYAFLEATTQRDALGSGIHISNVRNECLIRKIQIHILFPSDADARIFAAPPHLCHAACLAALKMIAGEDIPAAACLR